MIANNTLTYTNFPSVLSSWRPENDILYALAVAAVSTFLSFQATAALHDLVFGCKASGKACVSDICLFLLINSSSPSFVFRNLLQESKHEDVPRRERRKIFRLAAVLIIAPAVSVAIIALGLESDKLLTISEAGFGGVALGINPDLSTATVESEASGRLRILTSQVDEPVATFSRSIGTVHVRTCPKDKLYCKQETTSDNSVFLAVLDVSGNVMVYGESAATAVWIFVSAHLVEEEGEQAEYTIRTKVSASDLRRLANHGAKIVVETCGNMTSNAGAPVCEKRKEVEKTEDSVGTYSCEVHCDTQPKLGDLKHIVTQLSTFLTLVNTPQFLVHRREIGEPFDPSTKVKLLRRRNGSASLPVMTLAFCVIVFLRLSFALVMKNDLARGTGLILKESCGLSWCDSMLVGRNDICFESGTPCFCKANEPEDTQSTNR